MKKLDLFLFLSLIIGGIIILLSGLMIPNPDSINITCLLVLVFSLFFSAYSIYKFNS